MNADAHAAELDRVAALVRRMRPDWRDAQDFYELRSEIAGALKSLGRRLGPPVAPPVAPRVTAAPPRLLNGFARRCPACGKAFHTPNAARLTCSNACPSIASPSRCLLPELCTRRQRAYTCRSRNPRVPRCSAGLFGCYACSG